MPEFAVTAHAPHPLIHTSELEVRWGELDYYNHINNVHYFRYLEEARIRWMMQHRLLDNDAEALPVLLKSGITYLKSVRYPATLHIESYLGEVGARSVSVTHKIFDAGDRSLCYAEGYAKLVWIIPATGKSAVLPQRVRDALQHTVG